MIRQTVLAATLLAFGWSAAAQEMDEATYRQLAEAFTASLNFQTGEIELPKGVAVLKLSEEFRYLGPADAARVLEDAWGNPPGPETLGMVFPSDAGPLDEGAWGVILSYQEDGYVSDQDADSIDYAELMDAMKASTEAENAERAQQGYATVELVGWASAPHYDQEAAKLYWAKELAFDDDSAHVLNYGVRILGRHGVLVMNAVAGMSELSRVEERMSGLLAATEFKRGFRYSDFDPELDQVAGYGLAALVAGGVAAKTGLLAKLLALLLAGKKIIIALLIGFGALAVKLFRRKRATTN